MNKTLDPKPNYAGKYQKENKAVNTCLELIKRCDYQKSKREEKNRLINVMIEDGFKVWEPDGTRQFNSKLIHQAKENAVVRTKLLDFSMHATGADAWLEQMVTQALGGVLRDAGLHTAMLGKQGVADKAYMYGNGFGVINMNPDKGVPIVFEPAENSQVYIDPDATRFREGASSRTVKRVAVIYTYSWAEFCRLYPEAKKNVQCGLIKRHRNDSKTSDEAYNQTTHAEEQDKVEVCYYYDISNYAYVVFAGENNYVLEEQVGEKKYPFKYKGGKPYIPVFHMMCRPGQEGFYDYGIGDMLYELGILYRRLINLQLQHASNMVNPYELLYLPNNTADDFFDALSVADEYRARGERGFVTMDYDQGSGPGKIQSQSLVSQGAINEFQMLLDYIDREHRRMGFFLDAVSSDTKTATQILSEENKQNDFVRQTMDYFAHEQEEIIYMVIAMIIEFVSDKDKTPLKLTTQVRIDGVTVKADDLTYGMLARELRNREWFPRINSRSGAIPSNEFIQARLSRALQFVQPGSPIDADIRKQLLLANDIDFNPSEIDEQVAQGQAPQVDPSNGQLPPSGTDRIPVQQTNKDLILAR